SVQPIPCYGTRETLAAIRHIFSYIFDPDPRYEGGSLARLTLHEIVPGEPFEAAGLSFSSFRLEHGKMPVTGFRHGRFAYATDCNVIPEESFDALKGLDLL